MKLIDQLKTKMESIGGSLDEYEEFFCLDAPPGYVWASSGNTSLMITFANHSQTWLTKGHSRRDGLHSHGVGAGQ